MNHDDAPGAFDGESFLASVAREDGEEVAAFFRRLFTHGRTVAAQLDWGTGSSPAVAGWYLMDGVPSTVWVATTGGPNGRASVGVWLAELLPYVPTAQFEEMLHGFEELPLRLTPTAQTAQTAPAAQAADPRASGFQGRCFALAVRDLLANPAQVDLLFDALDRVAAAEGDMRAPFRAFISPYEWGERGEHGG